METGYCRISMELPKYVVSAILYLCGQCLKLERLKAVDRHPDGNAVAQLRRSGSNGACCNQHWIQTIVSSITVQISEQCKFEYLDNRKSPSSWICVHATPSV